MENITEKSALTKKYQITIPKKNQRVFEDK